jgi:hypothetical protein
MRRLIYLATFAVLALGACGGDGGGGSDREDIESIIKLIANSDEDACDKLTDELLRREFQGSKDTCVKQAKDSDEKIDYDIRSVDVNGDRATATVTSQNRSQALQFVKSGDDWKLDQIGQATSASGGTSTTPSGPRDEVAAQGSVDAFLKAISAEDETVLCGLLSKRYAAQLLDRPRDEAIADCLQAFKGFDWAPLQKEARGVTVRDVTVKGDTATGKLSNGESVRLNRAGDRWVIDRVGFE